MEWNNWFSDGRVYLWGIFSSSDGKENEIKIKDGYASKIVYAEREGGCVCLLTPHRWYESEVLRKEHQV